MEQIQCMKTPWDACLEGMILLLDSIMALFRSLEEGLFSFCLICLLLCNKYKNLLVYILNEILENGFKKLGILLRFSYQYLER